MDIYGMNMNGSFVVERLPTLPDWGASDVGRFLYDMYTGNYYLGAPTIEIGTNGWIPIGLISTAVRSFNIDWDTEMTGDYGKVSAINIPCKIESEDEEDDIITNVNASLNDIFKEIKNLQIAFTIENESIKYYHLDISGTHRVTAEYIPVQNEDGYFSGENLFVEDALIQIQKKTARDIPLSENDQSTKFGEHLGFTSNNVQEGLQDLELYLNNITAANIPCYYEGCQCDSNVQFVLDALYNLNSEISFTDLTDVPKYSADHRYLKSNGKSLMEWVTIPANDISAQYPGTTETNVQGAIWAMDINLEKLDKKINELQFTAEQISFDHPIFTKFSNLDDSLDYILNTFYSPQNLPNAAEISCNPVGEPELNKIQQVLDYLNNHIDKILTTLPCDIGAAQVVYNSPQGATNVADALTYIMGFISYMISYHNVTYGNYSP